MEERSQDRVPQFVRACAVEMHTGISQEPFYSKFTGKRLYAPEVSLTLCASLCSRNSDGHARTAILSENSFKKRNVAPQSLAAHCAQACTIEMQHGHVRTAILCEKLQKKSRAPEVRCTFCAGFPQLPAGKASPSIFQDTFCPAKHSMSCIRYKNACRARLPLKSENGRCENEAFVRDFPQNLTGEDVKTKLSRARLRSKTETGRCENEAFVRDFPQKVKAEDVKTKLSCETSPKFRKFKL